MTYRRVREQNRRYFERYPADQERAQAIVAHLHAHAVRLPDGDRLTPQRFQYLGMALGASDGFEQIHYLLDEAFVQGADGLQCSDTFLYGLLEALTFATSPLFAVLHESIYCQGMGAHWAAERIRAEYPEFDAAPGMPFAFTGEMIYPWMFAEDTTLHPFREAAKLLAQHDDWPALYDIPQLQANRVPCAAAVYADDMYVELAFSEETGRTLRGCRMWITNEYQHNGLRADGEHVLGRLIAMVRGEV